MIKRKVDKSVVYVKLASALIISEMNLLALRHLEGFHVDLDGGLLGYYN